jgi:hypothetical protein
MRNETTVMCVSVLCIEASQMRLSHVVDDELDIAGDCFRVHALRLFPAERGRGCENVRSPRTDAERGGSTREIGVLQCSAWYCPGRAWR